MARPRRLSRYRTGGELSPAVWRYLADLAEPGDEMDQAVIALEFFSDPATLERAWEVLGPTATAEHARHHPGCRPALWWRHTAPEPERRQLGGTGRRSAMGPIYGLPWLLEIDPDDPPRFESQAAYLRRLGLLLPGERPPPAAFEPEAASADAPPPAIQPATVNTPELSTDRQ